MGGVAREAGELLRGEGVDDWALLEEGKGASSACQFPSRDGGMKRRRVTYLKSVFDFFEAQRRPQRHVVKDGTLGAFSSDESYGGTQDDAQGQPAPIDPE